MNEDLVRLLAQNSLRLFEARSHDSRQIIAATDHEQARKIVGNHIDLIALRIVKVGEDSVTVEYDQSPGPFSIDLIDIGT